MSTWDCKSLGTDSDIKVWAKDPNTECVDGGFFGIGDPKMGDYTILLFISYISMSLYTLVPILLYMCLNRKSKCKIPVWEDPHACPNFNKELHTPCYNCKYCDKRQRYSWFYNKYHKSCYNFEFIVIVQKLSLSATSMFFSRKQLNYSLSTLIALNAVYIAIVYVYEPYLKDDEFLRIHDLGRLKANNVRNNKNKCNRKISCKIGINNLLDVVLFTAEIFMTVSAIITFNLEQNLQSNEKSDGSNFTDTHRSRTGSSCTNH